MSSKEKKFSIDETSSVNEEPFLLQEPFVLEKEYDSKNFVNNSNPIDDDIEKQLASFYKKEEVFKKNDITQKDLIKKYEEEIKELKNLNKQYNGKIKKEIVEEVNTYFNK